MQCLLCDSNFLSEEVLKNHYIYYHSINENDAHFKDLFQPNTSDRKCDFCILNFKKKEVMFLFHYGQMGGSRGTYQLPLNVLKRRPITYYTITYEQHRNFYDFFSDQIVEDCLNSVYSRYNPDKENKIQDYAEIINQQRGEFIITANNRVWLANTFTAKYFNDYVKSEIRDDIVKRIIINGQRRQAVAGFLKNSID